MKETVTLAATGAITTTGNGTAVNTPAGETIAVQIYVSAFSGTTPSITFYLAWSEDGASWHIADPSESFAAITTTDAKVKLVQPKGSLMRLGWVVSGTTPSFTTKAVAVGLTAAR